MVLQGKFLQNINLQSALGGYIGNFLQYNRPRVQKFTKKNFEYERTQKNDSCTMRIFNEKILLCRNLHESPAGGKSGTILRIGLRLSPLCLMS
jgi:hypothetical protein